MSMKLYVNGLQCHAITIIILLLLVRCSYKYAYNNMALYSSLMYFSTDVYIYIYVRVIYLQLCRPKFQGGHEIASYLWDMEGAIFVLGIRALYH